MTKKLFPTGVPVSGKDLVGRETEITKICRLMEIGQSVALVAPRRYGKTSLILEILDRLKKKHMVGYVDIFRVLNKKELSEMIVDTILENKKISSFVRNIRENLSQLISRIEVKQVIEDHEFVMKFAQARVDEDELLDYALRLPEDFAKKSKSNLIMVYDEFGDLIKLNGEPLIKKMRSYFQLHERVTYLFSGSQESIMWKLFTDSKQAFFRFAKIVELGPIPYQPVLDYITDKFFQIGVKIEPLIAQEILSRTKGHPYYTQLLCQNIYLSLKANEVKGEDISSAFEEIIISEKSYFEELWENLKSRRYFLEVIRFLAEGNCNPYRIPKMQRQQVYYVVSKLEEGGFIRKVEQGKYAVKDPVFKEFIVRQFL